MSMTSTLSFAREAMILGTRPHDDAHLIWIQRKMTLLASISSYREKEVLELQDNLVV